MRFKHETRKAMKTTTNNETKANDQRTNVLDFSTTLTELKKTVDPALIRQRAGRRDRNGQMHMVEYVEWHTVADILDEHAPNWGHTVKDIRSIGEIITVTVAITIDGVTREGVGTGKLASETGIKKAEHDALKRAAVKFGIARELYKKEFEATADQDEYVSQVVERRPVASDPMAKSIGDMVTAKQLGMIRAIGREAGVDVTLECNEMFKCSVEELSKRAASDLIDHLQAVTRNVAAAPMRRAG